MIRFKDIEQVGQIHGVDEYILVNDEGGIVFEKMETSANAAKIIFFCLKNSLKLAENKLKYICLHRETNNHIYIFPVGKFGLGVIKEKDMNDLIFSQKIIGFLNNLVNR